MAKRLKVSQDLALPIDLVTGTQAILARRRSGKSYTASVEAEEMLKAGQQVAVIDPTGAWWGLRSSADGKAAGYKVYVFGGAHQDAPLTYRSGKELAAALLKHGFSAIFDLSEFETDEQAHFVRDFTAELLRLDTQVIHLFIDEADTFAPQTSGSKMQQACLRAVSRLVRQGGIKGRGVTMITQRSASINWDVLSQIDMLTVLRMSAPLDIAPVKRWMAANTTPEFADAMAAELPKLPVGTAFFGSPTFEIQQRVAVRERETYNSGATPRPGERRIEPKVIATVDIQALGQKIADTAEQVRANSPEALKERIRKLEIELQAKPKEIAGPRKRQGDRDADGKVECFV